MRTEVWHPLSVHFPIVLLLLASVVAVLMFFSAHPHKWVRSFYLTLVPGVALLWLSVYLGDLADGIVSRKLCDPTVLKQHENFAWYTAWTYSGALTVHLASRFVISASYRKFLKILVLVAMLAGAGLLAYVGHLGASLVYEQAAGVAVPDADCTGF